MVKAIFLMKSGFSKYLDPANLDPANPFQVPLQKTVERSDGMLRPPNTAPLGRVPGTRMCRTKVHGRTTTYELLMTF